MDIKRLLLLLADTNHDGKIDLSDLPGVLSRVKAAEEQVKAVKAIIKEFADAGNLTSNGQHVTPEQLTQLWAEARAEFTTLGEKSTASAAAIKAETGIGADE